MLRQRLQFAASLLSVTLLAACSSHSPEESTDPPESSADEPAAEARKPTVFDDQLKALDKAKSVEETLKKAQAERDKQMDEQSGG
jgi:hypothetical protein